MIFPLVSCLRLEKLGLSPSSNGESLSFSYTIIHKNFILSDSTKKAVSFIGSILKINKE